jgi:hypothetical protein
LQPRALLLRPRFPREDFVEVFEGQADVVEPFEQRGPLGCGDVEGKDAAAWGGDALRVQVDGERRRAVRPDD